MAENQKFSGLGADIRLDGVTKMYGLSAAVKDLDLTVRKGEFVTLLGSSGSGKTTTLMMMAGFTTPTRGRISIGGHDVTALPPGKRDLGVVFQNYALFPHLTIAQNLAFPLGLRSKSKQEITDKVRAALEMVQLADKGGRYPRELSGGQQQRIALARAIIFEPQALLMDEPLGALDKNLREQMQMEIKRLHSALGATVVFVTHDQEEALTMSDRIAVMQDGRIAQIAPPREIYERPANRWVAEFVGQSNFLAGRIDGRDEAAYSVLLDSGERVKAFGSTGMSVGQRVTGILRPESVRLADTDATSTARLKAIVADSIYFGHKIKFSVKLPDGTLLAAQTSRDGHTAIPEVGARVSLTWNPESIWLIDEAGQVA